MELNVALQGLFNAENSLRTPVGITNPVLMSEQMMRISQYTAAVEETLAELERDFEVQYATMLKERILDGNMKVTQAEREVDIVLAEVKGQIKYLTRIVSSAWRQVGIIQSRINHLTREATTQI